jgi:hypothetical protein
MDRTRVVFQFDNRSLDRLRRITRDAGLPDLAATITTALQVVSNLQQHARTGATELLVRNPVTGRQCTIELASLAGPPGEGGYRGGSQGKPPGGR